MAVLKLEDSMQIPIDEVAEIMKSITVDDVPNRNYNITRKITISPSLFPHYITAGLEDQNELELKKFNLCNKIQEQRFQQELQAPDHNPTIHESNN